MLTALRALDSAVLATMLSLANAFVLSIGFCIFPRARKTAGVRYVTLLYATIALLFTVGFMESLVGRDPSAAAGGDEAGPSSGWMGSMSGWWLTAGILIAYVPLYVYLLSSSAQMLVELGLLRILPSPAGPVRDAGALDEGVRRRLEHLRESKLREIARRPTDAQLHREMVEIALALNDNDAAVYHAYALVEMLPLGHLHALACHRLAQIQVERQGRLDAAQPILHRALRLYPRSRVARYARRLVNQYEAYADLN